MKVLNILEKGRISNEMKEFLYEYSIELQTDMEKFGLGIADYKRPYGAGTIRNLQVFSNFPNFLNSS